MNAYKNERCQWVEFPSGKKVPFHHFPDFDQGSGKTGDTLVWYPKSNHLAVESQGSEASVLCYRPKLDRKFKRNFIFMNNNTQILISGSEIGKTTFRVAQIG